MKKFVVLLLLSAAVSVQAVYRSSHSALIHQMELSLCGGVSGLTYKSDFGGLEPGGNTGFDMAYILMGKYVGFRVGAALDYSVSKFVKSGYTDGYSAINVQGSPIDVSYNLYLSESHRQTYVSVPLQLGIGVGDWRLFIGPKVMYNLSARYKESLDYAEVDVYYPEYDVTIYDALAYSTLSQQHVARGKMNDFRKLWYGLAAETDYQFELGRSGKYLGVGVYLDYGFNAFNVSPSDNMTLLWLTDTRDGVPVSREFSAALEANHHQSGGQQLIRSFRYFDCGVKVSFLLSRESSSHSIRRCKTCPQYK